MKLSFLLAPLVGYLAMEHFSWPFVPIGGGAAPEVAWLSVGLVLGATFSFLKPKYFLLWGPLLASGGLLAFLFEVLTTDATMWPLGAAFRLLWLLAALAGSLLGFFLLYVKRKLTASREPSEEPHQQRPHAK